jgi:DNA-binding NtrC family response regulator
MDVMDVATDSRRLVPAEAARAASPGRWTRVQGISPATQRLEAAIRRVAEFACTTLITGETGCGKEEVARAIHAAGPRRDRPFVTVNCGGLPAALAESQFFGHEKGAFTGATAASRGTFRGAAGGVVFLDEIGEMPLELQPKLLQVLERREVVPVGGFQAEPIDVQVIAATNRDIRAEVQRGSFREDLFFRINTVHLEVPPLRARPEDIPQFIMHFSAYFAGLYDRPPWRPDAATLARLVTHAWPGNVRQLAQTVQRLYVFADSAADVLDDLLGAPPGRPAAAAELPRVDPREFDLKEVRRRTVRAALAATNGHLSRAAALLGVCANTMTKLVADACPERAAATRRRRPRRRPR